MSEEALEVVRTSLTRQGYPLEYATAPTLAALGYQTWQGLTYLDTETQSPKAREYDVLATVRKSDRARSAADVLTSGR